MKEEWKNIPDYPGYQVSNTGKVRSFWHKQKRFGTHGGTERILCNEPQHECSQSDDGNGYMKVYLQNNSKRKCFKVHRLVAEAFIPRLSKKCDTVDHIISGPYGKLNNSVNNLRWMSRRDNIKKVYRDGMCDERIRLQKKNILVVDTYDGREVFFESIGEAADWLGVDYTTVSHCLKKEYLVKKRFSVQYLEGLEKLYYNGGEFDAIYYN